MNESNVVPFRIPAHGGMARRGSPDKRGFSDETVEVECPECDAVLYLDTALLTLNPEVLCAGCDATVPLALPQ
ncbi:MAG: hypothetical protein ABJC28_04485 [Acidobacteriota bacterium]